MSNATRTDLARLSIKVASFAAIALQLATPVGATVKNGFDLTDSQVPASLILRGGVPRDGIPSIQSPRFIKAEAANYLTDEDRVLGYQSNGTARAYPVRILNWHEVVNDRIGDQGLLVTYCPLCGTGVGFLVGSDDHFGVSGLLYNSDLLLYDRGTDSLWSQIMGEAVSGSRRGESLKMVALRHTTWAAWRARHPETLVLSQDTGYRVDYGRDPYSGYETSKRLMFPVTQRSRTYHPKAMVVGVVVDGVARAYPLAELAQGGAILKERFAGRTLLVHFDADAASAWIEQIDEASRSAVEIPSMLSFWFAWYAFHPETSIYTHSGAPSEAGTDGSMR